MYFGRPLVMHGLILAMIQRHVHLFEITLTRTWLRTAIEANHSSVLPFNSPVYRSLAICKFAPSVLFGFCSTLSSHLLFLPEPPALQQFQSASEEAVALTVARYSGPHGEKIEGGSVVYQLQVGIIWHLYFLSY